MENDKADDLGLPQENPTGDEPMADGPAPEGLDMPGADAPLDDLDFEPLDMPRDGLSDDAALIEGAEPGDIDPDMLSPDPLAETAEFVEADADGLLSPEFADDEAAPVDFDPEGFGFPMDEESTADAELKTDEEEPEEAAEEEEEKESLLQKLGNASPYTVMLGIALLAIVTAILCLFMELKSYDFKWKRDDARVMAPHSAAPANPSSEYA